MNYVLITPARNEEALIEKTLQSVIAQTAPPERWVIVDDGSSDRTAEIVERYAKGHPWIELLRRSPRKDRTFAGKVAAVNAGLERDRKSTRLNSSHSQISYAVFCLKKKKGHNTHTCCSHIQ